MAEHPTGMTDASPRNGVVTVESGPVRYVAPACTVAISSSAMMGTQNVQAAKPLRMFQGSAPAQDKCNGQYSRSPLVNVLSAQVPYQLTWIIQGVFSQEHEALHDAVCHHR
jgi:hypothetical protein